MINRRFLELVAWGWLGYKVATITIGESNAGKTSFFEALAACGLMGSATEDGSRLLRATEISKFSYTLRLMTTKYGVFIDEMGNIRDEDIGPESHLEESPIRLAPFKRITGDITCEVELKNVDRGNYRKTGNLFLIANYPPTMNSRNVEVEPRLHIIQAKKYESVGNALQPGDDLRVLFTQRDATEYVYGHFLEAVRTAYQWPADYRAFHNQILNREEQTFRRAALDGICLLYTSPSPRDS